MSGTDSPFLRERRRFLALRACWFILRGRAVAWNVDISGRVRARNGRLLTAGCTMNGEPLGLEHIWHRDDR